MKLRKYIRHQCKSDYIGIKWIDNTETFEVIKIADLKEEKPFYLNYRVLHTYATITKFGVSLHEIPIIVYTVDI